ncbi:hypothetical protein [Paenibacillus sp. MMO-177]|uniref:hypothetical protein n=1 Tax=Paenibacillus sp. MMO-177 TaxID=3081289 RepID=UPI003018A8E8
MAAWILALFCWFIAAIALGFAITLTKEVHNKRRTLDYSTQPNFFNISSDSIFGWIFGAIVSIIIGLFVGFFFKILPWWLARSIHFGISILMVIVGVFVLRY